MVFILLELSQSYLQLSSLLQHLNQQLPQSQLQHLNQPQLLNQRLRLNQLQSLYQNLHPPQSQLLNLLLLQNQLLHQSLLLPVNQQRLQHPRQQLQLNNLNKSNRQCLRFHLSFRKRLMKFKLK